MTVGSNSICSSGCAAIVDSGTSYLIAPANQYTNLINSLDCGTIYEDTSSEQLYVAESSLQNCLGKRDIMK